MRSLIVSLFAILISFSSYSQYGWDYGVKGGVANYLGEFGGGAAARQDFVMDLNMAQTGYAVGAFIRWRTPIDKISIAASFVALKIHGADSLSSNPGRVGRNLSFQNNIYEITVRPELNFYTVHDVGGTGRYQLDFRAYFFTGLTVFFHNPQAEYTLNGETRPYDLQPMNLERLKTPYSLTQVAIPLGVGFYYTYKKKHRFGWEFAWRITFTDYLDDASTEYADPTTDFTDPVAIGLSNRRDELGDKEGVPDPMYYGINPRFGNTNKRGDPTHNDHYLVTTFNYSYVLRGKNSFFRQRYNHVYGGKKRRRRTRAKF